MDLSTLQIVYRGVARQLGILEYEEGFKDAVVSSLSIATLFGRNVGVHQEAYVHIDIPQEVFDKLPTNMPDVVHIETRRGPALKYKDVAIVYRGLRGRAFKYRSVYTYEPDVVYKEYCSLKDSNQLMLLDHPEVKYYTNLCT